MPFAQATKKAAKAGALAARATGGRPVTVEEKTLSRSKQEALLLKVHMAAQFDLELAIVGHAHHRGDSGAIFTAVRESQLAQLQAYIAVCQ